MKLTILGCSGTYPGPASACSSYLIEQDGFRLVLDAGNGSVGELQNHCDIRDVDAVLLSHLHGDHCLDLVATSYARRYHPEGMPPKLPVYGPINTQERLCGAFERWPDDSLADIYDFRTIGPGRLHIGPFGIDLARVAHPIEAYGVRINAGGRTLTYSGDTGACDRLVRLAQGSDLFLCEASFLDGEDNPPDLHLTGKDAGVHATRADVGRLVLTHLVPWGNVERTHGEARDAFDGDLSLASTGAVYEL
ncbi:Ribonuclease BN, tRNA processing enzyme [Parafrankia irregularis]|uniref:Ribonuclease BN, tRNA processing enzyme n=1 Tax=Parafrankia irregularis TaxID=795642 RepID=A0A0S4QRS7_9ACTN|nr:MULTISPECIES: MBL fold metallo-hydrolase [Parafrankia]MBE3202669.1 MBL fold metallo-hydrolase [Parafrankia sp. CH37]CUU57855.1 Ribonuclease BN, tRNA processing enzyme [Parafrankia irregularis]